MTTDELQPSGTPGEEPTARTGTDEGRSASRERRRAVKEWVVLIGIALVVAIVVRQFVFQLFYIPSASMVPRLLVDDEVFVNKLAYDFGNPQRGDVVVFKRPATWTVEDADLVKRIVGLPGETIQGKDGHVFIDGRRLDEPYLPPNTPTSDFGPLTVPAGRYFMMGDNRPNSSDARRFGPVPGDEFVGKVFMTVWPIDRVSVPFWFLAVVIGGVAILLVAWAVPTVRQRRKARAP